MKYHIFVILLAGGTGSRTKQNIPKQFIKIKDKYLAEYSIIRFIKWFQKLKGSNLYVPEGIIYVSHKDYLDLSKRLLKQYDLLYTIGGENRHDSTKEGLKVVLEYIKHEKINPNNSIIFIHDIARPIFLEKELDEVLKLISSQKEISCISLASSVIETIVHYDKNQIQPLNRDKLFAIKTPQILPGKYLNLFLEKPTKEIYTDLITWANDYNLNVQLIPSIQENIKITYPNDFSYAEIILSNPDFFIDY
ncbi:MAG: 2-C-methyl-D-erythritol 4-phosphate cytidylyltransferase [Leptospiraceae bacterium]|nr:MAG: 2-C-methyl-D-erythritol 4-phosphate cytidylyltransferase [Leptospiraceae bacterium]